MGQLNADYCTRHNSRCSGHNSKWTRFKNEITFSARFIGIFLKTLASKFPVLHSCSCFSERETLTLLRVHIVTQWSFVERSFYDHSMDRCSVRARQWEVRPHLSATATEADGCPVGACSMWSLTLSKGLVRFVQCKTFLHQALEHKHVPAVFLCRLLWICKSC